MWFQLRLAGQLFNSKHILDDLSVHDTVGLHCVWSISKDVATEQLGPRERGYIYDHCRVYSGILCNVEVIHGAVFQAQTNQH
jgi:hypothetical protein